MERIVSGNIYKVALAGSGSHVTYGYNTRGERTSTITKLSNNQQMLTTTQNDDVDDADIGISHRYLLIPELLSYDFSKLTS